MKCKLLLTSLFMLISISSIHAQVLKSVDLTSARLSTQISVGELTTVTDLTVTAGEVTADDITFMKTMTALSLLDMSAASTTGNIVNGFRQFNFKAVVLPAGTKSLATFAFYMCPNLTSIVIPEGTTAISDRCFAFDTSLSSVTLPQSLTSIGDLGFYECSQLAAITIPNSMTTINMDVFGNCSALSSVTIPEGVTTISDIAFESCTSLTSITLPQSLTTLGSSVFQNCTGLTSSVIPNSVTTIPSSLYYGCTGLTTVTLPAGLTTLGDYMFNGCTALTTLNCQAVTPPTATANTFYSLTPANIKLYVPQASAAAYLGDTFWGAFTTLNPTGIAKAEVSAIKLAVNNGSLQVTNNEPMATVELYTVAGAKLASMVNTSCVTFNNLPQGIVMVKVIANDGVSKIIKAMIID